MVSKEPGNCCDINTTHITGVKEMERHGWCEVMTEMDVIQQSLLHIIEFRFSLDKNKESNFNSRRKIALVSDVIWFSKRHSRSEDSILLGEDEIKESRIVQSGDLSIGVNDVLAFSECDPTGGIGVKKIVEIPG